MFIGAGGVLIGALKLLTRNPRTTYFHDSADDIVEKRSDLTGEEVCDTLRTEWRLYQIESIPESAYQPVTSC